MSTGTPVPEGFVPLPRFGDDDFYVLCGPLWVKADGDTLLGGFRVERRHLNPGGNCHGGMLATFIDVHLGLAAMFARPTGAQILPTISLSLDYLAPTLLGAWVEARPEIDRITRGTAFVTALLRADGEPVARARGIFKIVKPREGAPPVDTGDQLRRALTGTGHPG